MLNFFYICEFLEVTPKEFFDTETSDPAALRRLSELIRDLPPEQISALLTIVESIAKAEQ